MNRNKCHTYNLTKGQRKGGDRIEDAMK